MSKTKRITIVVCVILLVCLILFTIISRSVYTATLPKVQTVKISSGAISSWAEYDAEVWYEDTDSLVADGTWIVTDVFVGNGDAVKEGTPLFSIDTKESSVETLQMEIDIKKMESDLDISADESDEYYNYVNIERMYSELKSSIDNNTNEQYLNAESNLNNAYIAYTNAQVAVEEAEKKSNINENAEHMSLISSISEYEFQLEKLTEERDELQTKIDKKDYSELKETEEYLNYKAAEKIKNNDVTMENQKEYDKAKEKYEKLVSDLDKQRLDKKAELDQSIESYNTNYEIALKKISVMGDGAAKEYTEACKDLQTAEMNYRNAEISFENTKKSLETKLLELEASYEQAQNAYQKLGINQDISGYELELAYTRLQKHLEKYPKDGIIRAKSEGILNNFQVKKNDYIPQYNVYGEIVTDVNSRHIKFEVPKETMKKYSNNVDINIFYSYMDYQTGVPSLKSSTYTSHISKKEFDNNYQVWSVYSPLKTDSEVLSDMTITAKVISSSANYDMIIPTSCLVKDSNDYYVYKVIEDSGIWGLEYCVTKVKVDVIYTNNITCAISSNELFIGDDIVQHTSLSISSGDAVYPNID